MGATRLTFIGENAMFTQKNKDSQTTLTDHTNYTPVCAFALNARRETRRPH